MPKMALYKYKKNFNVSQSPAHHRRSPIVAGVDTGVDLSEDHPYSLSGTIGHAIPLLMGYQ